MFQNYCLSVIRMVRPTPKPGLTQRHAGFRIVSLLTALLAACAGLSAEQIVLLGGRCTVELPHGWRVEQNYGETAAVIHPPDARAWPVEIVLWPVPKGALETPGAAAMAHEAAIGRLYPYARVGATDVEHPAGLSGLQVVGRIQPPGAETIGSVFQAFAGAGHYCVVGTFCLPDRVDATVSDFISPTVRGLRLEQQPGVPTVPAPIRPVVTPLDDDENNGGGNQGGGGNADANHAAPPAGVDTPTVSPATPAVTPQADTVPTMLPPGAGLLPLAGDGIKLNAPLDYMIEATDEWWLVRPRGAQRHTAGILVWPLVCTDQTCSPQGIAEEYLRRWPPSAGLDFDIRPMDSGHGVIFSVAEQSAAGTPYIMGTCVIEGESALLSAIYGARDLAATTAPMLARMLGSLQIESIPFGHPDSDEQTEQWQMPRYPDVSLPIPKGWRARGAITRQHGHWAISFEAVDPGPERRYVSWQQPIVPLFRELTTLLEGIGYKQHDQYASDGGGAYTLYRRPTAQSFLLDYWCGKTRLSLQEPEIIEQTQPAELSGLVHAVRADALLAVVRGRSTLGVRENTCAVALARADHAGVHNWQAAVLEAGGPAGDHQAVDALRTMLMGLRVEPDAAELDDDFRAIIARVQLIVGLLPARETDATGAMTSVLRLQSVDGDRRWQPPHLAGEWWISAHDTVLQLATQAPAQP